jgi:4-alpha-glucanotransferase
LQVEALPVERSSGVLLHVTSLPGGRLGSDAFRFVDWLASAGQTWWQVLPLGPPDRHGAPYASGSAFSAWPALLAEPDEPVTADDLEDFVARHPYWIADWAAYAGSGAIAMQVRFEREWASLRRYAGERGVRLMGDIPFYVARGGADQRAHPSLFRPELAAGVPPDDWSATGQLWGQPVYDWPAMRRDEFHWWIERFRRAVELFDMARIDHFRGFVAHWVVDVRHRTARHGHWQPTPGRELFTAARQALGPLPFVAENLGVITPAVERLRADLGFPGTVVLQFVFGEGLRNPQQLTGDEASVVYTGTHDNPTASEWWQGASEQERAHVASALDAQGMVEPDPSWMLIRLALASGSRVAMIPAQDVLGLGAGSRMNRPGRARGNWAWRLQPDQLTPDLAARLRAATEATGRTAGRRTGRDRA